MGLLLYTVIRGYVAIAAALLITGWLVTGSPARRCPEAQAGQRRLLSRLWLLVSALFVLGLLWLSWTAMTGYSYATATAGLRAQVTQMELPKPFYSTVEAATRIWEYANSIPRKIRTDFQLPVLWLLLTHLLARFVWRFRGGGRNTEAELLPEQSV